MKEERRCEKSIARNHVHVLIVIIQQVMKILIYTGQQVLSTCLPDRFPVTQLQYVVCWPRAPGIERYSVSNNN